MKHIYSKAKVLLIILSCIILLSACAGNETEESTPTPDNTVPSIQSGLIGFIVFDSQKINEYMAMYGFLETAEYIGITGKLYRFKTQEELLSQTQKAIDDGCDGVVLDCSIYDYPQAITLLKQAQIPLVTVFNTSADENINIYINNTKHYADIALLFAEKIKESGQSSGKILIYSDKDSAEAAESFTSELKAYDYSYEVISYQNTAADTQGAIAELTEKLSQDSSIYGIFATNSSLTNIAVQTVEKSNGKDKIFVIGTSLTDTTIKLFEKGLFGLCVNPVNEALVTATHTLSAMLKGQAVEDKELSWHIANADTIHKYAYIRNNAKDLFGG